MESIRTHHDTGLLPPRSIFRFEVDFFAVSLIIVKVVLWTKVGTIIFRITTVDELQVNKCVVIEGVPAFSVLQRLAFPIFVKNLRGKPFFWFGWIIYIEVSQLETTGWQLAATAHPFVAPWVAFGIGHQGR